MEVKCATSFDERFDPNNVLNKQVTPEKYVESALFKICGKDPKKFWVTTGLYPHELLIDLGGTKPINDVKFTSTGIKKVIIEGCKTTNASEFKKVGESKELTNKSGVQNDSVRLTDPAPYCLIKFVIQEGYDDFSSVHNIEFA